MQRAAKAAPVRGTSNVRLQDFDMLAGRCVHWDYFKTSPFLRASVLKVKTHQSPGQKTSNPLSFSIRPVHLLESVLSLLVSVGTSA